MNARAAQLERALGERDAQLAALRHSACEEARALLAEGFTPRDLVTQLLEARCVVCRLCRVRCSKGAVDTVPPRAAAAQGAGAGGGAAGRGVVGAAGPL